jgi:hypothetical protein
LFDRSGDRLNRSGDYNPRARPCGKLFFSVRVLDRDPGEEIVAHRRRGLQRGMSRDHEATSSCSYSRLERPAATTPPLASLRRGICFGWRYSAAGVSFFALSVLSQFEPSLPKPVPLLDRTHSTFLFLPCLPRQILCLPFRDACCLARSRIACLATLQSDPRLNSFCLLPVQPRLPNLA